MNRRQILGAALAGGFMMGTAAGAAARAAAEPAVPVKPLPVPRDGKIKVGFAISRFANVIDFAGPWETFGDTVHDGDSPFELFTIAETTQIVEMASGLRIEPTYSFDAVPFTPNVIVVGAQSNGSEDFMKRLRDIQGHLDITMSVCTGAFKLAKSGILDGKSATTHHEFYDAFAKEFPQVNLIRGVRFVDDGSILTAGGLTSGIAAALHVIERYFDAEHAARTAAYMEYVQTARPA